MVFLRYERLPIFCYFCGHLGHGEKDCEAVLMDEARANEARQYGDWLRTPDERKITKRSSARRSPSPKNSEKVPIRKSAVVLVEKSISCNIQDGNQPIPKKLAQKGGEFMDSDLLEGCELNVESSSKKDAVNLAFDGDSIMEIDLTDKKESSKECGGDVDNDNDIIRHGLFISADIHFTRYLYPL
ncbi:hypothetical protein LguiB_022277 [Lonicera macranthoides]